MQRRSSRSRTPSLKAISAAAASEGGRGKDRSRSTSKAKEGKASQERSRSTSRAASRARSSSATPAKASGTAAAATAKREIAEADSIVDSLVIWRRPDLVAKHCFLEALEQAQRGLAFCLGHGPLVAAALVALLLAVRFSPPALVHQVLWAGKWIALGVASSIGMGTGMHTFLLFLAPHIAQVVLFAHECNNLAFDASISRDLWECDESQAGFSLMEAVMKVQFEAIMWGMGTAIGELPPYFVARAARLAGKRLEELEEAEREMSADKSLTGRAKKYVLETMEKVGFVGVLLMASIPNPLFDLAGLTCGHLLFPFWKFFGATLIGKAFIKSNIQAVFVVGLFSPATLQFVLDDFVAPLFPADTTAKIREHLHLQKAKYTAGAHHAHPEPAPGYLGALWNLFIVLMVSGFVVSLLHAVARSNYEAQQEKSKSKKGRK